MKKLISLFFIMFFLIPSVFSFGNSDFVASDGARGEPKEIIPEPPVHIGDDEALISPPQEIISPVENPVKCSTLDEAACLKNSAVCKVNYNIHPSKWYNPLSWFEDIEPTFLNCVDREVIVGEGDESNELLPPIKDDNLRQCTQQYEPVCGELEVQCVKAPCNPIQKTYANACEAGLEKAKIISQGVCGDRDDEYNLSINSSFNSSINSSIINKPPVKLYSKISATCNGYFITIIKKQLTKQEFINKAGLSCNAICSDFNCKLSNIIVS